MQLKYNWEKQILISFWRERSSCYTQMTKLFICSTLNLIDTRSVQSSFFPFLDDEFGPYKEKQRNLLSRSSFEWLETLDPLRNNLLFVTATINTSHLLETSTNCPYSNGMFFSLYVRKCFMINSFWYHSVDHSHKHHQPWQTVPSHAFSYLLLPCEKHISLASQIGVSSSFPCSAIQHQSC